VSDTAAANARTSVRTVGDLIDSLTSLLVLGGVESARKVSVDIVAALLEVPRSWPLMHATSAIAAEIADQSVAAAKRLIRGMPFSYAVQSAQFRHLNLFVDQRVLIPRPETEQLVTEVLEMCEMLFAADNDWDVAIDVGTGSGAIALSLASEGRFERVIATDASSDALEVAGMNAGRCSKALKCEVELRHGSLMSPVRDVKASVVVANPPYIAYSEIDALPASVRDWEPPLALFSGREGMAATAEIIRDAAHVLRRGGILALEVDERRAVIAAEMVMANGSYNDVSVRLDLTGRERFVLATRS
jgi:release factor glutamine methyltransferase